ncbi:hypothetical protein B0O99DRAFT_465193, partial [Bisporella sp. PMI_857]
TRSTSKTVLTTDFSFSRFAFKNGIFDLDHFTLYKNFGSYQNQLDKARNTASPSELKYKAFCYQVRKAFNEITIVFETFILLKRHKRGYSRVYNQAFNDFSKNVSFNNGLSATQLNIIESFEITKFDLFLVR